MDYVILWDYMFFYLLILFVPMWILHKAIKAYEKKYPPLTEIEQWVIQYQKDLPTVWVSEHTQ